MYCQITRIAPWRSLIMTLWGLKNPLTACKHAISMHITPSFMCMLSNFNLKHTQSALIIFEEPQVDEHFLDQPKRSKHLQMEFIWNGGIFVKFNNLTGVIYICIVGLSTLHQHIYIYILILQNIWTVGCTSSIIKKLQNSLLQNKIYFLPSTLSQSHQLYYNNSKKCFLVFKNI